jgi:hypothetical protein
MASDHDSIQSFAASAGVSSSTCSTETRRTVKEAQAKRTASIARKYNRDAAYQIGTILMKYKKDKKLSGYRNKSPIDLIKNVNALLGDEELVSPTEISRAVRNGNIGSLPPRMGTTGKLPEGAIKALSDLFFSFCALSQHNTEKNLTKPEQYSLLSAIIDPYFKERNEETMNVRKLFERIQERNAYRQDVDVLDRRDMIRFQWYTYKNLLAHYENMAEFLVEQDFARRATPDEIEIDGELIKWFDNQRIRGMNFDEVSFSLDYSSNGQGGRPPSLFLADGVQRAGEGGQKSSYKVTFFFGMTYGDEALPGCLILPLTAEFPQIKEELIKRMHQIEGQFGHKKRKKFDIYIAASPKGSMTAGILGDYLQKMVNLYPDMNDAPGKRLFCKLDSGPGRDNKDVLSKARLMGVVIYPGVPNTSEGTQEMDKLFAYSKGLMERNRQTISVERKKGGVGVVTVYDLALILFGGELEIGNGTPSVELPSAFELGFDAAHLKRAREACGYCPFTRNALHDPKCRRVLGDLDLAQSPGRPMNNVELSAHLHRLQEDLLLAPEEGVTSAYDELILSIEECNLKAHHDLSDLGFKNAMLASKMIDRREEQLDIRCSTLTYPNTRERQDLLAKANTAGRFFKITGGGAAMNCDDMLIAIERKGMAKKVVQMIKKKKKILARTKVVSKALAIMEAGTPSKNEDLKFCIEWKNPGAKTKPKGNKESLLKQWEKVKNKRTPAEKHWTAEHDRRLSLLQSGDVSNVKNTSIMKRADARKCTFLDEQIKLVSAPQREDLLLSCFTSLSPSLRQNFIDGITKINGGEAFEPTCFEYDSDEEYGFVFNNSSDGSHDSLSQEEEDHSHHDNDDHSADEIFENLNSPFNESASEGESSFDSNKLEDEDEDSVSEAEEGSSEDKDEDDNKDDEKVAEDSNIPDDEDSSGEEDDDEDIDKGNSTDDKDHADDNINSIPDDSPANDINSGDDVSSTSEDDLMCSRWDQMSTAELIEECKQRAIPANRRYKPETLISKLKAWETNL